MLVAVDMDEVLADFISSFLDFHNQRYGTSLTRDRVHSYYMWKVLGGTREEMVRKIDEFYGSKNFEGIQPVSGAVEGIRKLKKRHNLVVVTSRPTHAAVKTWAWIEQHFSGMIHHVCFSYNSYSQAKSGRTKSEICIDLGVELIIEDSLEYAAECASGGRRVLLLDCPWNRSKELHRDIERVYSWREITKKI